MHGYRIEGLKGQLYCRMSNSHVLEEGWCPDGHVCGGKFNDDAIFCALKDSVASAPELPEPPKITRCCECVYYKEVDWIGFVCTANSALAMKEKQWCDCGLAKDDTLTNRYKLQAYIESVEAARTGREME